jgi:hypothetical protein
MDMRAQEDGTPAERFDAVRAERHAPGATRSHDESDDFVRRSLSRYYQ